MRRIVFSLLFFACATTFANSELSEWVSVHTNAIAKWKTENNAPDGVFVEKAARRVRFLVEATGVRKDDSVEFLAIGPLSDRAYEALFVSVASPAAIAAAFDDVGLPRGRGPDPFAARLWPYGEKVTMEFRAIASTTNVAVTAFVKDVREKDEGTILGAPVVWTAGLRDAGDIPVANTNMPGAVFALYNHAPSLLQLDGMFDQSGTYGRFVAADAHDRGELFEVMVTWDGKTRVKDVVLTLNATNVLNQIGAIKKVANGTDAHVRLNFEKGVTVGEAVTCAQAFDMLDGNGIKMNGVADGQFYFRSFLPDPGWRERAGRIFQPFEVHIDGDGQKTFIFCEEDWSGDGTSPILKPRSTPFAEWNELTALISKTGEQGAKVTVLFIFAPKMTKVEAITPIIPALGNRINTYYIFAD